MTDEQAAKFISSQLTEVWLHRIEAARDAKKPYQMLAQQCYSFYAKASGFMWNDNFRKKHIGEKVPRPKFEVTMNKAFELVALFGPYLFWRYPYRSCVPNKPLDIDPMAFGDVQDPMMQMLLQQLDHQEMIQHAQTDARCQLMEKYLNYTQREQPGKLAHHAQLAIVDGLIKGRGLLWPEIVTFPGSNRKLTGLFYDSVDNLFIDPDCGEPTLDTAQFIVKRHVTPADKLERRFNHPRGSLREMSTMSSRESVAQANKRATMHEVQGKTHDLIVWYEIWSKCGIGVRHPDYVASDIERELDDLVGDYAYLCVAQGVPWFLNAPPPELSVATEEEINEMFDWPLPTYMDNRWPVAILDFYKDTESCWPIPPLGPAMGELTAMNIITSVLLEQAWDNRKTIIAYLESCMADVEDALRGDKSPALVKINDSVQKSVGDMIQILNRPNWNDNLLEMLDRLAHNFDKRTGLSEFLYAATSTQSRSAADVRSKEERASIRPDKMSQDVAAFIENATELERFLAILEVTGRDVVTLVGAKGAYLWDQLITGTDPETVFREMRSVIEAKDMRKPNKAREADNLQQMLGYMLPLLQQYATLTADSDPLNAFIDSLGDSIEQDTSAWRMGPWAPQPPDEFMQQQQMEQLAAETDEKEASAELKRAQAAKQMLEAQMAVMAGENEAEKAQVDMMIESAKHQQSLAQDAETHDQKLAQMAVEFAHRLEFQRKQQQQQIESNRIAAQRKFEREVR